MAFRPVFVAMNDACKVETEQVEFTWYPGLSKSQKQRSISSLHESARNKGFAPILEISTKSAEPLGIALSAFNLCIHTVSRNHHFTVESAFQASKIFERGGPFKDLLHVAPKAAKADERLKEMGKLVAFEFFGDKYPLEPKSIFYDWVYLNALNQNADIAKQMLQYRAFTDIEFNPQKSYSCQAFSAALYVSLCESGELKDALNSFESFKQKTAFAYSPDAATESQRSLF